MLELSARYHDPKALAVAFSKALDAGAEGVLSAPSPMVLAAFAELDHLVPIVAVMGGVYEHELLPAEPAITGWPPRPRLAIGLWTRWRRAVTGITYLSSRHGLAARVARAIEVEAPLLPRKGVRAVVLASTVTDLALAAGHRAFFKRTLGFLRTRFGVSAGLETSNLGVLLVRLSEWGIEPDFVTGPLNPLGLQMKPSAAETLEALRGSSIPVIATELRAAGMVPLDEAAAWARAQGAWGIAPDLADVDDASLELKSLASSGAPGAA